MKKKAQKIPNNWIEVWDRIEDFRSKTPADVDTMGCHTSGSKSDPNWRYHILCALQLSSQTKDPITFAAVNKLKKLDGGLSPQTIANIEPEKLNSIISKVGFHNRKTQYMIKTAQILIEEHNSDIPKTIQEMVKLPGVGPKMAYLAMQEAWGEIVGIGVDTHVHRISNRLGWVKSKNPEDTRYQLEGWLPQNRWAPVNSLLVGFGQTLCKPAKPDCSNCPVNKLCPKVGISK